MKNTTEYKRLMASADLMERAGEENTDQYQATLLAINLLLEQERRDRIKAESDKAETKTSA